MARQPRFQYPGAVYHLMARGDGGKQIFIDQEDHESFLFWLEKVCGSHGWRVHAWVLMGNHFHLLLETPEPNLSSGMRVLMGTFSQAWNHRHQRRGHVFQGRYKSVPVTGERAADAHYFKAVADYIHLNPARAGLAGGAAGKLAAYPWSSLRHYGKGEPPAWLVLTRVLDAFKLSHDRRGRSAYVTWLEKRAASDGGKIDEESMAALRRGWYLGEDRFKDKLLGLMEQVRSKARKKDSHAGGAVRAHNESEAERIIRAVGAGLGMSIEREELMLLRKGDRGKVICAAIARGRTAVSNDWLAERLAMGHGSYVSSLVNRISRDKKEQKALKKYEKLWKI
jgi:putative transposase